MSNQKHMELPQSIRDSLASVMRPGEGIKITYGTQGRVILNESSIGTPQNRLEPIQVKLIESLLHREDPQRGPVQLTENGNPKTPQIEITAVSKDEAGKTIVRKLLRQERDLTVSAHPVDLEITKTQMGAEQTIAEPQDRKPAPYRISPETKAQQTVLEPVFANTLSALERSVSKLPESNTKALWQRIATDFAAINEQRRQLTDSAKRLGSTVAEVPSAIGADVKALIDEGKQRLEAIQNTVQARIQQTSSEDVKSAIAMGASKLAEAGSQGLGMASSYLQDRAEKVRDYGTAKAALAIYQKGHERTGESHFKVGGYTVEALTNGYAVRDSKDRMVMSFGTDSQGRPVSVTKAGTATLEDSRALNQMSKASVITGSQAGEKAYTARLQSIVTKVREVLQGHDAIQGQNYYVSAGGKGALTIRTTAFPRRELIIDSAGNLESNNLTLADFNRLEETIEKASQNVTAAIESARREPAKERAEVTIG